MSDAHTVRCNAIPGFPRLVFPRHPWRGKLGAWEGSQYASGFLTIVKDAFTEEKLQKSREAGIFVRKVRRI